MSTKKICPECRQTLSKNAADCFCGWKSPQVNVVRKRDNRCEYVIGNRRCPLVGGISTSTHAGGPWYCGGHWRALSDPKLGEAVLRDAEENYEQILEARKDWRIKLWEK